MEKTPTPKSGALLVADSIIWAGAMYAFCRASGCSQSRISTGFSFFEVRALEPKFLAVVCLLFSLSAMGQGSLVITFDELSRDEHLTEQYSSLGVHFVDLWGGQPYINITPAFPSPTGPLVGYAAQTVYIRFDRPVVSFTTSLAIDGFGASGQPGFEMSGIAEGATTAAGSLPSIETWYTVSVTAPPGTGFSELQMRGTMGARDIGWDFDNVRITFVPEPSVCALFILGLAPFAPRFFRFRKRGTAPHT